MRKSENLRDYTLEELELLFVSRGLPAFRGRQIFRWLTHTALETFYQMTDLPKSLQNELAEEFSISLPELIKEEVSTDGTRKLGLKLADGEIIECVLIPEVDHHTLCVSSQVGCAMGCTFCLTAQMGFRRNLTPGEIIGQVIRAKEVLEREGLTKRKPLRNLVFMGMGEPLANYDSVLKALKNLLHPKGFNFSSRRVTVSTVGLVPQILRLGQDILVRLAISLHAPDDETRNLLIPINKRYPIRELLAACRKYPLKKGWRITFEYVLLAGVNDSLEAAKLLANILRGLPVKINLIPFNEHPDLAFRRPKEEVIFAFQKLLLDAGYVATIRKSRGQDISAACGQLRITLIK